MSIFGEDFYCPGCGSIRNFEFEGFDYECLECGRIFYPPGNIKNGNHYLGLSQVKHSDLPDLPGGETLNGDPRIGGRDLQEWLGLASKIPFAGGSPPRTERIERRTRIAGRMMGIWHEGKAKNMVDLPEDIPSADGVWLMCEIDWVVMVLGKFMRQGIECLRMARATNERLWMHGITKVGHLAITQRERILSLPFLGDNMLDKIMWAFSAKGVYPSGLFESYEWWVRDSNPEKKWPYTPKACEIEDIIGTLQERASWRRIDTSAWGRDEWIEKIGKAIQGLEKKLPRFASIIKMRYGFVETGRTHTLREVGRAHGITPERVRQVVVRSLVLMADDMFLPGGKRGRVNKREGTIGSEHLIADHILERIKLEDAP